MCSGFLPTSFMRPTKNSKNYPTNFSISSNQNKILRISGRFLPISGRWEYSFMLSIFCTPRETAKSCTLKYAQTFISILPTPQTPPQSVVRYQQSHPALCRKQRFEACHWAKERKSSARQAQPAKRTAHHRQSTAVL